SMAGMTTRMSHEPFDERAASPRGRTRRGWLAWAVGTAVAAIAAAAFTGGVVASRYEARLGLMARETAALRQRLQRDIIALEGELAVYRSAAELLRDPATQVLALRGVGPSPQATGRVVWHAVNGGHMFVANLPPPPPGKAYELWTIGAAAPQPAGVFQVDAQGRGSHRIVPVDAAKPVRVFAVTLEPAGGVPAPTGPMVLASK
ncbi:MAG: anti-sigma factor, partial [candidate division NC10 bacterium]